MLFMHGLYELKPGVSNSDFQQAFSRYANHLIQCGYIVDWHSYQRCEHPGYNLNAPPQPGMVAMVFKDLEQANRCWDYVEADQSAVSHHHKAVNSIVTNIQFFLSHLAGSHNG